MNYHIILYTASIVADKNIGVYFWTNCWMYHRTWNIYVIVVHGVVCAIYPFSVLFTDTYLLRLCVLTAACEM